MKESDEMADDFDSLPPMRREKSGCGTAVLIICGLVLLLVLVCGGTIGWFTWSFWPKMTDKPAEVTALSKQILDMEIPDEFEPGMAISMDNNFAMSMKMVMYKHKENKGSLMLGSFKMKVSNPGEKPDLMGKNNDSLNLQMGDSKVKEIKVRGKDVPFRFSDAVEEQTNKKYRVVEGEMESEGVTTFLKLILEEDSFDEDEAIQMIESIR